MKREKLKALVFEDDLLFRAAVSSYLEEKNFDVFATDSKEKAIAELKKQSFQLTVLDMMIGDNLEGPEVMQAAVACGAYTVVFSSVDDDDVIENNYLIGCDDYFLKLGWENVIDRIIDKVRFRHQDDLRTFLKKKKMLIADPFYYENIKRCIAAFVEGNNLLLEGETGVGKTCLAQLIHEYTSHEQAPFIALNCSEIPESLFESELFGHKKGAFTGADRDKKGFLELANGGTLFLDEIGSLPLQMQAKLLKAVEEKSFYAVGSEFRTETQFRLICATCEGLNAKIAQGLFRKDLYFRISHLSFEIPPLRKRPRDIELFIDSFLLDSARRIILRAEAKELLLTFEWPGNVRQLDKVMTGLVREGKGIIDLEDIGPYLGAMRSLSESFELDEITRDKIKNLGLKKYLKELELAIVSSFYRENNEKVRNTIRDLKISPSVFYNILKK